MRKINIVIFSSGVSEKSGTLANLIDGLTSKGYNCFCWRDLFKNAKDKNNIALLPMLIKKIPTFDFAVLICEGHDITTMYRNNEYITVPSMRDNVLFEIGLSSMALGLSRVILLTDSKVHIPDDLIGINGQLAFKHIIFNNVNLNKTVNDIENYINKNKENYDYDRVIDDIDEYINNNKRYISPVVIGAATSIAIGYVNNFIIRLLENIVNGFDAQGKYLKFSKKHIYLNIIIPEHYDENTVKWAKEKQSEFSNATLKSARHRDLTFNYKIKDADLYIYDFPTTLVTSYSTAKMILDIQADDETDNYAEKRFNDKELDLFVATLKSILRKDYILNTINLYYPTSNDYEKQVMIDNICYILDHNFKIERVNN